MVRFYSLSLVVYRKSFKTMGLSYKKFMTVIDWYGSSFMCLSQSVTILIFECKARSLPLEWSAIGGFTRVL